MPENKIPTTVPENPPNVPENPPNEDDPQDQLDDNMDVDLDEYAQRDDEDLRKHAGEQYEDEGADEDDDEDEDEDADDIDDDPDYEDDQKQITVFVPPDTVDQELFENIYIIVKDQVYNNMTLPIYAHLEPREKMIMAFDTSTSYFRSKLPDHVNTINEIHAHAGASAMIAYDNSIRLNRTTDEAVESGISLFSESTANKVHRIIPRDARGRFIKR